jgi:maltose O-acetyltransferase
MNATKTEKEKMLAGELYDPRDPVLASERLQARRLCQRLAAADPADAEERQRLLTALFGTLTDVWLEPPFHCDYGRNVHLGRGVFFNFGCVILDVMSVRIGDHTLFGPAVQIYTAMHPLDADERRAGLEFARPVTIGRDVWIGGAAVICPGVTIGDRAVIGAGSVVTRDVPPQVFAAGNPCRVVRALGAAGAAGLAPRSPLLPDVGIEAKPFAVEELPPVEEKKKADDRDGEDREEDALR